MLDPRSSLFYSRFSTITMALVASRAALRRRRRLDQMDRSRVFLWHGDPAVMVAGAAAVIVGTASPGLRGVRGLRCLGLGGSGRRFDGLAYFVPNGKSRGTDAAVSEPSLPILSLGRMPVPPRAAPGSQFAVFRLRLAKPSARVRRALGTPRTSLASGASLLDLG